MIPPWTKPGTKVVVVKDTGGKLPVLHKGLVVTVERMVVYDLVGSPNYGEIGVRIVGIDHNKDYPNPYRLRESLSWWPF